MNRRLAIVDSERGAAPSALVLLLGGGALAGLIVGGILGFTGAVGFVGEPAQIATGSSASYYDCPGGAPLGNVHSGDRVFITGRDASGQWVEVRSPADESVRAWVWADHVVPDATIDDLPVVECPVTVAAVAATTVPEETTTTVAGETTTTTVAETTTTIPETTTTTAAATTTTQATTTTTTAAPPSVNGVSATPGSIWEKYLDGSNYSCSHPETTTTISASVTAAAGVQSVTLSWSGAGLSGGGAMTLQSGSYVRNIGPFDASSNAIPQNTSATITVTVTVTDSDGHQAIGQTTFTVYDCTFG